MSNLMVVVPLLLCYLILIMAYISLHSCAGIASSCVARAAGVVADRRLLVNLVTDTDEKTRLPADKSGFISCTHPLTLMFSSTMSESAVVCSLVLCIYVMMVPCSQYFWCVQSRSSHVHSEYTDVLVIDRDSNTRRKQ